MGFHTRKDLPAKTVNAPIYSTFKNIVISVDTHLKSFVVACIYRTSLPSEDLKNCHPVSGLCAMSIG